MAYWYVSPNLAPREALVFEAVQRAISVLGAVCWPNPDFVVEGEPLGLRRFYPREPVIAFGLEAHSELANVWKKTLIATDITSLSIDGLAPITHLERLFWSSSNTFKLFALGHEAWQVAQMLPLDDRQYFDIPPISLPPALAPYGVDVVYVINHEKDGRCASELAKMLMTNANVDVRQTGHGDSMDRNLPFYSGAGAIHIHVGYQQLPSQEIRIKDSLASGCFVIQLVPPPLSSKKERQLNSDRIIDEIDGLLRHNIESVKSAYNDIRSDYVFRRNIVERGVASVMPLLKGWRTIALELLKSSSM